MIMVLEMLLGMGTAVVTPRLPNGSVNYASFERLLKQQYTFTDFLIVLGTTGEAEFLHLNDKEELIERTVTYFKENGRNKPVIVGASAGNTSDAILRSQMALQLGADALLITPPPYVKPRQAGIVNHYESISKATGNAPIVVYNVPSRVGVNILPDTLEKIADCCNVIAVKEASGDLKQLAEYVIVSRGRFNVLSGDDATTYEAMGVGAKGVISVVGNVIPQLMHTIISAHFNKEFSTAYGINERIKPLFEASMKYGNPVSIKAIMHSCGYDVGEAHPSLGTLNQEEMDVLQNLVRLVGDDLR